LGDRVAKIYDLPPAWELKAQLVFGTPNGPPRSGTEKVFADVEPRIKVLGVK